MNPAQIIDSITDDIGKLVAAWRGTRAPVTTAQTNAGVVIAQQQQQQNTLLFLGLGALALVAFTRKG